jgi:hypothetical protein
VYRLEEVPDVHLYQPLGTGMLLRGTNQISAFTEGKASIVNRSDVQDILSNPPLHSHQLRVWYADSPIATRRSRYLVGQAAFLHAKNAVWVDLPMRNFLQKIGGYVCERG